MKVALVRRSYSAVGGAELYLQRLIAGLAQSGHELHILAESWPENHEQATLHQMDVHASRAQRPLAFAQAVAAHLANNSYECVFSLERTLRQDIYRAGDGVHRVWLQQRKRYLPWWRTLWTGRFHRTVMELEQQTFNPANTRFVIANSEMVKQEIVRCFNFPQDRIVLIRNGVDVKRFRRGNREVTRAKYGFGSNDFVCLFVGSGWERKGLKFLISALPLAQKRVAELRGSTIDSPAIRLIVAGKDRTISAGKEVIFAGPVKNIEDLYAAADLFTFVPIYEPCANACVEALAAGLPVITSQFNGAAELITSPERGTVLNGPADTDALANEIAQRANIRNRSRVQVPENELSIERNVAETLRLMEQAARQK